MRAQESVVPFNNAAAGTSAAFELMGGHYVVDFVGTGTGTVVLQRLGPDQTTWLGIALTPAITVTAGDPTPMYLAPGQYRVVITTTTNNYVSITRCPEE